MIRISQLSAAQLHEALEISARNVERVKQKGMPAMAVRFICGGRALTTQLTLRRQGLYLADDIKAGILEARPTGRAGPRAWSRSDQANNRSAISA